MAGHTYENAWKILEDVRHGLNEHSSALVAGTDTSGKYSNAFILQKMNEAQRIMYALLMSSDAKQYFFTSTTIVGSNSVYTLPADFGKIVQFRDSDGNEVFPSSPRILPTTGGEGNEQLYYRAGTTFVLNKSGLSETHTLYYYKAPRDLTAGIAGTSSGLNTLYLEDSDKTRRKDDYYNNITVDNYSQGLSGLISDYVGSTRAATTGSTITHASGNYYGTVSELPEMFHFLIAPLATMLVKDVHPAAQEKPTAANREGWHSAFSLTLSGFIGAPENESLEDIFCDFGGVSRGSGINIPGQGYTIY